MNRYRSTDKFKNSGVALVYAAVQRALKSGKLKRQPCERCGSEGAQAHHEDYSRALDVNWLCIPHHTERHRELDAIK